MRKHVFAISLITLVMIAFSPPGHSAQPSHSDYACSVGQPSGYNMDAILVNQLAYENTLEGAFVYSYQSSAVGNVSPVKEVCDQARSWPVNISSGANYDFTNCPLDVRLCFNWKADQRSEIAYSLYIYQPRDGLTSAAA